MITRNFSGIYILHIIEDHRTSINHWVMVDGMTLIRTDIISLVEYHFQIMLFARFNVCIELSYIYRGSFSEVVKD